MKRSALCIALVLSWTDQLLAEEPRAGAQREARQHFEDGLTRAAQGDLSGALAEFESAYKTRPHFSVLYNIGQAKAALDRPAEAVDAFERYLAEGATQLSAERRDEIRALIETNRKRFGLLRVTVTPPDTQIWLDGNRLATSDIGRPLPLALGKHTLIHATPDGPPQETEVVVLGAQSIEAHLSALPRDPPAVAQLAIECAVPGVAIGIGGSPRATTPLTTPILVPKGAARVQFSRAGYAPVARDVVANAERTITVKCEQHPILPISPLLAARLELNTTPTDALVLIDGQPFHGGSLVSGPHTLRVESDGYLPEQRALLLVPGKTSLLDERLVPTAATLARDHERRLRRQRTAMVLGGAGVAFLGTGAAVYAWNSGRYADWESQRGSRTQSQNLDRVASIQRADDAAIGLIAAGTGLVLSGAWLFFTTD